MTMHWADLILILAMSWARDAQSATCYCCTRFDRSLANRDLQIADQLAPLDDAIRALETRLAEQHAASELIEAAQVIVDSSAEGRNSATRKKQRPSRRTSKR